MTQFSPNPSNPYIPSATRTRLRWDNLAVLCAALAVLGGATTTILSQTSSKPKAEQSATAPAVVAPAVAPSDAGDATTINAATLEDASMLVSEARDFISQGRWEEAADRLASVDASVRPATEADIAQRELEAAQGSWNRLDAQLRTQVDAKDWADARVTLDQLATLAPLGEEQLELQDHVEAALAPAVVTKPKPEVATDKSAAAATAAKPATTTGGGATTAPAAKPVATTPKPAATTSPKPAATTTPKPKPAATTPKPAAGGGSTTTVGGITITVPSSTGTGTGTGTGQEIDAAQIEQLLGAVAGN